MPSIYQLSRRIYLVLIFALLLCSTTTSAYSQVGQGGEPHSFRHIGNLPTLFQTLTTSPDNIAALLSQDELDRTNGIVLPPRYGFPQDVDLDLSNSGTWTELPDGGRLWRLRLHSPGARFMNLVYDEFVMPSGASFFVYNDNKTDLIGGFTSENNKEHLRFATGPVKGDASILEYYEPADVKGQGRIKLSRIILAVSPLSYRHHNNAHVGFGASDNCQINVRCSPNDFYVQKPAVAMLLDNNGRFCTGSLLNNTAEDRKPYFLTALHCHTARGSDPSTWIFMFNYESPACSPTTDGPTDQTVSGASIRAQYGTSDVLLLELDTKPSPYYRTYYLGWNAQSQAASSTTGIHHPNGDVKKISRSSSTPVSSNSRWFVSWNEGITAIGSSGSPLFDQNKRVIGQLWGGDSFCDTPYDPDYYGQFHVSWNGGGSSSTRLLDWLDPAGAGSLTLDGNYGPVGSSISGPDFLAPGEQGTWHGIGIGGDNNYSYEWRVRDPAGSSWSNVLSTTSSLGYTVWYDDIEVKVAVTSAGLTSESILPVFSNAGCAPPAVCKRGESSEEVAVSLLPQDIALSANYPNPFNPSTQFTLELPSISHVKLSIFDVQGREIALLVYGIFEAGSHSVSWNAGDLPSGLYIARLEVADYVATRAMLLIQ